MTTRKSSPSFRRLMRGHIKSTFEYVEAVYKQEAKDAEAGFAHLKENIGRWAVALFPNDVDKQEQWVKLFTQHTVKAGELAEGIFKCECEAPLLGRCAKAQAVRNALQALVDNQTLCVNFLCLLLGESHREGLNKHWTAHLHCTFVYIQALSVEGVTSQDYKEKKKDCLAKGTAFGEYLDSIGK